MGEEIQRGRKDEPNESGDFLGTTKFDIAKYVVQELFFQAGSSLGPLHNQIRVLALIILGKGPSGKSSSFIGTKRKRPLWSSKVDFVDDGACFCYLWNEFDDQSSMDGFGTILQSLCVSPPAPSSVGDGDFVNGIVRATDAMLRTTTVGASLRRIVLVTDARHRVLEGKQKHDDKDSEEDPMERLATAVNNLAGMGCQLQVVGMGFSREKFVDRTVETGTTRSETPKDASKGEVNSKFDSDSESDEQSTDDNDDDEAEDDWSDIQDQNELLTIDLVEKLGGCVLAVNGGASCKEDEYGVRYVLKQLGQSFGRSTKTTTKNEDLGSELPLDIDIPKDAGVLEEELPECLFPVEEVLSL